MKRVISIIAWTAGAFIITAMAMAFATGSMFFFVAMSGDKSDTVPRSMGWVGIIVPIVVAASVFLVGLRGHLPGTKLSPSKTTTSI